MIWSKCYKILQNKLKTSWKFSGPFIPGGILEPENQNNNTDVLQIFERECSTCVSFLLLATTCVCVFLEVIYPQLKVVEIDLHQKRAHYCNLTQVPGWNKSVGQIYTHVMRPKRNNWAVLKVHSLMPRRYLDFQQYPFVDIWLKVTYGLL